MKEYLINGIVFLDNGNESHFDYIYRVPCFASLNSVKQAYKESLDDFEKKYIRKIIITDIKLLIL